MAHLHHSSPVIRTRNLFKVCVREVDPLDNELLVLDVDEVADIIGVLCEDEDTRTDDFRHRCSESEGQGNDASP